MIRGMISAVVVLVCIAGPTEAQYRVKTRFPWLPQQGSATGKTFSSGQTGRAHFNPKELTIDKPVPWQKSQPNPNRVRGRALLGQPSHQSGPFAGRGLDIARVDGQIVSPMIGGGPFGFGLGAPQPTRRFAPVGFQRGMFRR